MHAWKPKAYSNTKFDQKIKKYSDFQTGTINDSKQFFSFYIKQYWQEITQFLNNISGN